MKKTGMEIIPVDYAHTLTHMCTSQFNMESILVINDTCNCSCRLNTFIAVMDLAGSFFGLSNQVWSQQTTVTEDLKIWCL